MKRKFIVYFSVIALFTCMPLISGCTFKRDSSILGETTDIENEVIDSQEISEEDLNKYLKLLSTLDVRNKESIKVAMDEMLSWNVPIPDEAIRGLLSLINEVATNLNSESELVWYFDRAGNRIYYEDYGLVLAMNEGDFYANIDLGEISKIFANHEFTPLYNDLFSVYQKKSELEVSKIYAEDGNFVVARENDLGEEVIISVFSTPTTKEVSNLSDKVISPIISDGFVTIPWKDFVDVIILYENFVETYPDSPEGKEMKEYLNSYIAFLDGRYAPYIFFDDLDTEIKEAYEYLFATYPESTLIPRFEKLYKILEENNFKDTKIVRDYVAALTHIYEE